MRLLLVTLAVLGLIPAPARAEPTWYKKKKDAEALQKAEEAAKAAEKPAVGTEPGQVPPQPPAQPPASAVKPQPPAAAPTAPEDAPSPGAPPTPAPSLQPIASPSPGASPQPAAAPTPYPGFSAPQELNPVNQKPKADTNLLFKAAGVTDSLNLEAGRLIQPQLSGIAYTLQYGMGWWATPRIVASPFARVTAVFESNFTFFQVTAGVQGRYFITQNWVAGALAGFGGGQGLSRLPEARVPLPPSDETLATRFGLLAGIHGAYLFWPSRSFGVGPAVAVYVGSQGERSQVMYTIGVTFQSGRPAYDGDLTAW